MIDQEILIMAHCPRCGVPAEYWTIELPIAGQTADAADDAGATEVYDFECERCGYEFSVTVRADLAGWVAFLTEDPSEEVLIEHYTFDGWIDDIDPMPHPYTNFQESMGEWQGLVKTIGDKDKAASAANRMLLTQLFSILEAYLADAIIKLSHEVPSVSAAIIEWHPELKKQQVSLKSLANEPNLARDIVVAKLKKTQFHRFEFINGLLKASMQHNFLPSDKTRRDLVMESIKLRHDCVHRNGRDEEGNVPEGPSLEYLNRVSRCFVDIADALAKSIDATRNSAAEVV